MKKILDYEEMIDILNKLSKENIKEEKPIGYTEFGYPIRHYTYGTGENHIILTAGTHSVELITNCFLIKLMEEINKGLIDKNKYTIHFIPILNPEGTIIVTSAIRSLIKRSSSEFDEQLTCIEYYTNSKLEDDYSVKYNDKDIKLHNWMFRYTDIDCISDEHKKLKESVKKIIKENNLPRGVLIEWGSNGSGIDLNANIENNCYLNKKIEYGNLKLNTINKRLPGPIGCPTRGEEYELELENKFLINFYKKLKENNKVIGSLIYHSCGGLVICLDKEYENKLADKYAEITGYKKQINSIPSMDFKLKTIIPGTLLIELSTIRANPLGQFIDYGKNIYTNTIDINIKAFTKVIEEMLNKYNSYSKIN